MKIGIPKEIKKQEHRVGMTPAVVSSLVKRNHKVIVQEGAGIRASFSDALYESAGAQLVPTAADVFQEADLIVKVKEPPLTAVRVNLLVRQWLRRMR